MDRIQTFDSLAEMQQHLDEQRAKANVALHDQQRTITYGSHVVGVDHDIIYFGYVSTLAEVESAERKCGAEPEELLDILNSTREMHDEGLMFGRYHSVVEPDGELGSNHRFNLWPLDPDVFRLMQALRWNPNELSAEAQPRLALPVNALILHQRGVTG